MPSTYEPIATQTLSASSTSLTFSSIPQTYTDLLWVISGRATNTFSYYVMRFNGDAGANYNRIEYFGDGTVAWGRSSNETEGYLLSSDLPTATNTFDVGLAHILGYSKTTVFKHWCGRSNNAESLTAIMSGHWRSTAAITSIVVTPYGAASFTAGSTFTLYGIKAA